MQVTVIIPNYNGERWLTPCLDSLAAQTRPARRVVVVDNGSRDRSREIILNHPLTPALIALDHNTGFAHAVNLGLAAAETEVIALLNADAEADPRWIEAGLTALLENPDADMAASLMLSARERDRVDSAGDLLPRDGRPRGRGRDQRAAEFTEAAEVLSVCAGAAFYRRRLFESVGGFEESFVAYLEDLDFCLRARRRGRICLFAPGAVVYHQGAGADLHDRPGKRAYDSSQRVEWIARNRVRLLARNLPWRALALWSPRLAIGLARSALYHLLSSRQFAAFRRGLGQGIRCLPEDRKFFQEDWFPRGRPEILSGLMELVREGARPWPQ